MQTNNRKGFSLIELLIVVVIIGILAAIAIPKFSTTKEKAYVASMKADLRNLATAQEAFFADSSKYATLENIKKTPYKWTVSDSVNVKPTIEASATGWSANLVDARVANSTKTCSIFNGDNTVAANGATQEGVILGK